MATASTGVSSLERLPGLNRGAQAALAEQLGGGYGQAGRQGALLSPERSASPHGQRLTSWRLGQRAW